MHKRRVVMIGLVFLLTLLAGLDPRLHEAWAPHRDALVRGLERLALPFRVAWLAGQRADAVLLMPVTGAKVKHITDTWGAPRPGGRVHRGQDIFAQRRTPVRAATAGYVVRLGRNTLGGNIIVIAGAGGRRYYYAHLDSFAPNLRVGQHVTTETILGFVGKTGNAVRTPPHLHLAIYTITGPTNPLPLLRDRLTDSP